jgi:hypothetical protein
MNLNQQNPPTECDTTLAKIRKNAADRQARYKARGGKNQNKPHDHRDDVILELREEIRDLKKEIRELRLRRFIESDGDSDSDNNDNDDNDNDNVEPHDPEYNEVYPEPPENIIFEENPMAQVPPEVEEEMEDIIEEAQEPHIEAIGAVEEEIGEVEEEIGEVEEEIGEVEEEIGAVEEEIGAVEEEIGAVEEEIGEVEEEIGEVETEVESECQCHSHPKVYTLPIIIEELKQQEWDSEKTLKITIGAISTFFGIVGCDNIPLCLESFEDIKVKLETTKQKIKKTELYSTNSKILFVRAVLVCITRLKIPIEKNIQDKYLQYFTLLKMQNERETAVIRESRKASVISFPEYLRRIKEKFGEASKQYLVAMMYSVACVRDDYGAMSIVDSIENANDNDKNYLIINDTDTAYFIFHQFKTARRYGTIQVELPDELITLLKIYIQKHNLTNTLFGENKKGLSDYISNSMNKKIGVAGGGSNAMRHMMISTLLDNANVSDEERVELAKVMGHSPNVQYAYKRFLVERESQQQSQNENIPENVVGTEEEENEEIDEEEEEEDVIVPLFQLEDLHRRLLRERERYEYAQDERDEANEALEVENNIRREHERLLRVERERNHSEQPEPKKQKRTRGQGVKRKGNNNQELPRKITRKVTL